MRKVSFVAKNTFIVLSILVVYYLLPFNAMYVYSSFTGPSLSNCSNAETSNKNTGSEVKLFSSQKDRIRFDFEPALKCAFVFGAIISLITLLQFFYFQIGCHNNVSYLNIYRGPPLAYC